MKWMVPQMLHTPDVDKAQEFLLFQMSQWAESKELMDMDMVEWRPNTAAKPKVKVGSKLMVETHY